MKKILFATKFFFRRHPVFFTLAAVFIVLIFSSFGGNDSKNIVVESKTSTPAINARIIILDDGILVFNEDDYHWKNTTVRINGNADGTLGGYVCRGVFVEAKKQTAVYFRNCIDLDSKRFNPNTHKATTILVHEENHDARVFTR
jgi:hypothetical protein